MTFRILTPEQSAANERLLRFTCPCAHPHHFGLWDGRTLCGQKTSEPGPCPDCRKGCAR